MDELLIEAKDKKEELLKNFKTIILSTINKENLPNSSYAPSVVDKNGDFYIYISELSKHTTNLLSNPLASLMIIEDESKTENIFARKRFTMNSKAVTIDRDSGEWNLKMDLMENKFGEPIKFLKTMTDFHLFKITPNDGLLVHGFARAFRFVGPGLNEVKYLNDKGHTQDK
ncbi:MAG: pyridoxamine 5-phosphate oxidase [Candidatus Marinimicrobia bacterium]|nr:pyridoxamine 5-phosphate oxidase [Candidatus Neomarinimicrobiota bacterium]|tara:strand:- start:6434 stop:6946 length:513 start_codon:yes stop_codon:yes gene_type:complete